MVPTVGSAPRAKPLAIVVAGILLLGAVGIAGAALAPVAALAVGGFAALVWWFLTDLRRAALVAIVGCTVLPIQFSVAPGGGLPLMSASRALVLALVLAWSLSWAQGRVRYRPSGIEVALFLWLGAGLLSIPGSIDVAASWNRFGSDAIEYVGLFVVLSSTLRVKDCPAVLKALIAAATLNAAIAIADVGLHLDLAHRLGGGVDGLVSVGDVRLGFVRAQGTFQHPAFLATVLAMAIPLTYGFFVCLGKRLRIEHWGILLVQVVALGLTATRAAWFACALGVLGVLIASVRHRPWLWWHLYGSLALLVVALIAAAPQINEITTFVRDLGTTASARSTATTGYRFELVRQSLEAVHVRPLFGYGLGDFGSVGIRGIFGGRTLILTSPDNHLVRVVVETGVIGLSAFLALAAAIGTLAVRTARSARRAFDAPTDAGLAWAVFAFGVINCTISAFAINQVGFYFWTIVAVLVVRRSSHRRWPAAAGVEHGLPPNPVPAGIS